MLLSEKGFKILTEEMGKSIVVGSLAVTVGGVLSSVSDRFDSVQRYVIERPITEIVISTTNKELLGIIGDKAMLTGFSMATVSLLIPLILDTYMPVKKIPNKE